MEHGWLARHGHPGTHRQRTDRRHARAARRGGRTGRRPQQLARPRHPRRSGRGTRPPGLGGAPRRGRGGGRLGRGERPREGIRSPAARVPGGEDRPGHRQLLTAARRRDRGPGGPLAHQRRTAPASPRRSGTRRQGVQQHPPPAPRRPRQAAWARRTAPRSPSCGDSAEAKRHATELLDVLGYDAVDAGPLEHGRLFAPGTPAYGAPYSAAPGDSLGSLAAGPASADFLSFGAGPASAAEIRALLAKA